MDDNDHKVLVDKLHEVALGMHGLTVEMKESRKENEESRRTLMKFDERLRIVEINQRGLVVKLSIAGIIAMPILSVIGKLLYDMVA